MRLAVAILAGLFLLIGWADSSVAGDDVVCACVAAPNGAGIRIVTEAGMCRPTETEICWSRGGAPESAPMQLVGCAEEEGSGNAGVLRFNRECQDTFGPGSRMCSSVEILNTVDLPDLGQGLACWTRPVLSEHSRGNSAGPPVVVDASGIDNIDLTSGVVYRGGLSCNGWSTTGATIFGLKLSRVGGRFIKADCNGGSPPACCAPGVAAP